MKIAYLDCAAGISGDMLLGALIDAGASASAVTDAVAAVGVEGWALDIGEVTRAGLRATKADVRTKSSDAHRPYATIRSLIEQAGVPAPVRDRALATFAVLAQAEARVHAVAVDDVEFHEVGGIDAIVDVVGCAAAIHDLGVEHIVCSPLPLGSGVVATAHGELPVPAPAVTEILRGKPVTAGGEGETTTPTGAALAVALATEFGPLPEMTLHAVGWGAGTRDTQNPNVVRVLIGERAAVAGSSPEVVVEANIDDLRPEMFPYVIERLLEAGAQDAWVTPVVMKKGRPAHLLSALCERDDLDRVVHVVFTETTTFGLRITEVAKEALERSWVEVDVAGHRVRVKVAHRGGSAVTTSPEYEDAVRAARATGLSLKDVYDRALAAAAVRAR